MIRGNADLIVLQPIFNIDARRILHEMYGGIVDRDLFFQFMDEVVIDENLPGSTPQEPKKRVRTMVINDFENTTNPQLKFRWWEASDPGEFRLLHPAYWKEDENVISGPPPRPAVDIVAELDSVSSVLGANY